MQSLPFEFIVVGKPLSKQTKDKTKLREWRSHVTQSAKLAYGRRDPIRTSVKLTLTHYYEFSASNPDTDNIVKPFIDALSGVLWDDDRQVDDFLSRRRNLEGSYRIRRLSPVLAEGFCKGEEFIHVLIEDASFPEIV